MRAALLITTLALAGCGTAAPSAPPSSTPAETFAREFVGRPGAVVLVGGQELAAVAFERLGPDSLVAEGRFRRLAFQLAEVAGVRTERPGTPPPVLSTRTAFWSLAGVALLALAAEPRLDPRVGSGTRWAAVTTIGVAMGAGLATATRPKPEPRTVWLPLAPPEGSGPADTADAP